jgi:cysteine-rich repeat protein
VCGNGKLEVGEECDDGGHAGKDGCSADCKVTCADFGAGHVESDDHHCYIGYDQADFAGSEAACSMRGAHLATISSEGENKLVHGLVHNSKWLGGMEDVPSTTMGSGAYAWITGEPFTFTNWAPKEPNQAKARCSTSIGTCYEHCLSMLGDGTWADERCDMVDGYVCEWEPAGSQ